MKLKYRKKSTKTGKNFRGGGEEFFWSIYTPVVLCKCNSRGFIFLIGHRIGLIDRVVDHILVKHFKTYAYKVGNKLLF